MKIKVLLIILTLSANICFAQNELPTVVPDRPGHTFGADVTHFQKLGWDNGFAFEKAADGTLTFTLNSTILRYGLFQNMELRVGTDFLMYDNEAAAPTFGFAPLTVGTKIKFNEGSGFISTYPHMIMFPAIFISILMITFNLVGNGLRDAFNPTLRGEE